MKTFMTQFFTWWNGPTLGTRFFTWRKGTKVGEDQFGNVYYEGTFRFGRAQATLGNLQRLCGSFGYSCRLARLDTPQG